MNETTTIATTPLARREPNTMKAVVQRAYGSAEVLTLEVVAMPTIADNEVLIRVRAASVNHADWVYTTGLPMLARLSFGLGKPRDPVRGKDVAGLIEAVGADVTRFQVGDEVYGEVVAGAFAEYAVASADLVAIKPANLTFEQTAAVPLAARTALQGLRDGGKLQAGQTVLINGASGGVGTFAVQIAKALGAEVTGVCSTRNAELVQSLGADHVVDYTRDNFTEGRVRYDLILDLIGNHSLTRCRRALAPEGTLVLSNGTGSRILGPMGRILRALVLSMFVRQNLRTFTPALGTESLNELRDLIESGQVTPAIDRTYPLNKAPEAIRYFAEDHARGKIVITV